MNGSVSTWIRQAYLGDDEAVLQLWNRYWRRMLRTARRKLVRFYDSTKRNEVSQDITSLVFAEVFNRIKAGKSDELYSRSVFWNLLRVAIFRRVVDLQRKDVEFKTDETTTRSLESVDIAKCSAVLPSDFAPTLRDDLESFLKLISPDNQQILLLSIEGYNQSEIGERVGLNRRTVNRRLVEIRRHWVRFFEN